MKQVIEALGRFLRDDSGTEIVEWAIVGGLVVAAGAAVFVLIGGDAKTALNTLEGTVKSAAGTP